MSVFIYLASQSPRRSQLLDQLGVAHRLLLPDAHEDSEVLEAVLPGETPLAYVQRVTDLKLQAAQMRLTQREWPIAPILCSDTTVALGRAILGKPRDAVEAAQMLGLLAGRTHRVMTAIAVGNGHTGTAARIVRACSVSRVTFAPLSAAQVAAYVASGEPMGKAGAYAVQGLAAAFIACIDGSYSGIMGLPLFETAQALRALQTEE